MKTMKVNWKDSGEVRCPLRGEYFRNSRGFPEQAIFNFEATKHPILVQEIIEEEEQSK